MDDRLSATDTRGAVAGDAGHAGQTGQEADASEPRSAGQELLPFAYATDAGLLFGELVAMQWLDTDGPSDGLMVPAVALDVAYSESSKRATGYSCFRLVLPPAAARKLAAALIKEAGAAEAAGAPEWEVEEAPVYIYQLRMPAA